MIALHVGIDDTDSKRGMCTTYIAAVLVQDLQHYFGVRLAGMPKLVRLDPNCPFKTRGNAALAFSIELRSDDLEKIKRYVLETVEKYADIGQEGTDPGVVFLENEIPDLLRCFANRVVKELVSMEEAIDVAQNVGAEIHRFGYGRGIIGALAAIGYNFPLGRTYELMAYRIPDNRGSPRRIDYNSVIEMDRRTYPFTFDNVDYETGEIRITPHTPCPVLFGIRGLSENKLREAFAMVKVFERIERYQIFVTNQATDAHVVSTNISNIEGKSTVRLSGVVCRSPIRIQGGHVIFRLNDGTGEIDCAAYEPTKKFRDIVSKLCVGDQIEVYGTVKPYGELHKTVNLEKILIKRLATVTRKMNPLCPSCRKRMKSEGRFKGYQCPKCKYKNVKISPIDLVIDRELSVGLYAVPPRARRHLSKPILPIYEI